MADKTQMLSSKFQTKTFNVAIIGGGNACVSFLKMIEKSRRGILNFNVLGVADIIPDSPGSQFAKEVGIPMVTTDFRDLYELENLEILIELTGNEELRKEVDQTKPAHIKFVDSFGASLFWELYVAEESIKQHKNEIKERVEMEREWMTQIFDSIPDEILVLDINNLIQNANASFLHNNNLTIDEVRWKYCYEVDLERGGCRTALENCPFHTVLQTKKSTSIIRKTMDKNGNIRYHSIVCAPMLDKDGELTAVIESTSDITNRIQLEEELKTTEGQLRQFMELAPVATFVKNPYGQYLEVNQATCDLYKRNKNEILGKTDLEICTRDAAAVFRESDQQVLKSGAYIRLAEEVEIHGQKLFLSTIKFPIYDSKSEITAICGLTNDVTELKQAEIELIETKEYLLNVLENSPEVIVTTDMEGKVVSFNQGAEETLGFDRDEVIGEPASMFYKDVSERRDLLRRVIKNGAVRNYETNLVGKESKLVPVILTLSKMRDSAGNMIGTVGMAKDVTKRKMLTDQVMQSERLAAVGRLASGVAHEINNPLAVISEIAGYLNELIIDDPKVQDPETLEELTESLPKIIDQVKRCRSITSRLLSFARKSEARIEITDVNSALDEILPFMQKEARLARVTFHRDYHQDLPKVQIEEMQLQEIFINIIHNGIQALQPQKNGNIWISTTHESCKVIVKIKDDGPGISEEVRDRLFDPFVTTKPTGQGTGLGLSICYGIVKRYDGQILVDSKPNEGATFTVALPTYTLE